MGYSGAFFVGVVLLVVALRGVVFRIAQVRQFLVEAQAGFAAQVM